MNNDVITIQLSGDGYITVENDGSCFVDLMGQDSDGLTFAQAEALYQALHARRVVRTARLKEDAA